MPEKKIDGGSCAVERISGAGCYQSSIALSQSLLARSTMGRPAFRLATNLGLFRYGKMVSNVGSLPIVSRASLSVFPSSIKRCTSFKNTCSSVLLHVFALEFVGLVS